jgi:4-azaleucine resistance transporter AzlC
MGLPFCASSVVYGVAFGLLAAGIGLSSVEAVAMSALVFSGSAQVAVIQAWHSNPSFLAVFVTVFIANVRYVLMSATLRDWLAPLGGLRASAALLPMVDGTFALSYVSRARGDYDAGILLGSSLISYSGWIAGTAVGTVAGQLITNPRAIGLDFIIVSFCVASATLMYRGRADILPGLAAIAAVVGCEMLAPGPWTVVAAGVAAALTGALLGPDGTRQSPSAKLDERQA